MLAGGVVWWSGEYARELKKRAKKREGVECGNYIVVAYEDASDLGECMGRALTVRSLCGDHKRD
jgi:hypothetical protein